MKLFVNIHDDKTGTIRLEISTDELVWDERVLRLGPVVKPDLVIATAHVYSIENAARA